MLSIGYSLMYNIIEILKHITQRIQINLPKSCISTLIGHDYFFSMVTLMNVSS